MINQQNKEKEGKDVCLRDLELIDNAHSLRQKEEERIPSSGVLLSAVRIVQPNASNFFFDNSIDSGVGNYSLNIQPLQNKNLPSFQQINLDQVINIQQATKNQDQQVNKDIFSMSNLEFTSSKPNEDLTKYKKDEVRNSFYETTQKKAYELGIAEGKKLNQMERYKKAISALKEQLNETERFSVQSIRLIHSIWSIVVAYSSEYFDSDRKDEWKYLWVPYLTVLAIQVVSFIIGTLVNVFWRFSGTEEYLGHSGYINIEQQPNQSLIHSHSQTQSQLPHKQQTQRFTSPSINQRNANEGILNYEETKQNFDNFPLKRIQPQFQQKQNLSSRDLNIKIFPPQNLTFSNFKNQDNLTKQNQIEILHKKISPNKHKIKFNQIIITHRCDIAFSLLFSSEICFFIEMVMIVSSSHITRPIMSDLTLRLTLIVICYCLLLRRARFLIFIFIVAIIYPPIRLYMETEFSSSFSTSIQFSVTLFVLMMQIMFAKIKFSNALELTYKSSIVAYRDITSQLAAKLIDKYSDQESETYERALNDLHEKTPLFWFRRKDQEKNTNKNEKMNIDLFKKKIKGFYNQKIKQISNDPKKLESSIQVDAQSYQRALQKDASESQWNKESQKLLELDSGERNKVQLYKDIIGGVSQCYLLLDDETNCITKSENFKELVGMTVEEFIKELSNENSSSIKFLNEKVSQKEDWNSIDFSDFHKLSYKRKGDKKNKDKQQKIKTQKNKNHQSKKKKIKEQQSLIDSSSKKNKFLNPNQVEQLYTFKDEQSLKNSPINAKMNSPIITPIPSIQLSSTSPFFTSSPSHINHHLKDSFNFSKIIKQSSFSQRKLSKPENEDVKINKDLNANDEVIKECVEEYQNQGPNSSSSSSITPFIKQIQRIKNHFKKMNSSTTIFSGRPLSSFSKTFFLRSSPTCSFLLVSLSPFVIEKKIYFNIIISPRNFQYQNKILQKSIEKQSAAVKGIVNYLFFLFHSSNKQLLKSRSNVKSDLSKLFINPINSKIMFGLSKLPLLLQILHPKGLSYLKLSSKIISQFLSEKIMEVFKFGDETKGIKIYQDVCENRLESDFDKISFVLTVFMERFLEFKSENSNIIINASVDPKDQQFIEFTVKLKSLQPEEKDSWFQKIELQLESEFGRCTSPNEKIREKQFSQMGKVSTRFSTAAGSSQFLNNLNASSFDSQKNVFLSQQQGYYQQTGQVDFEKRKDLTREDSDNKSTKGNKEASFSFDQTILEEEKEISIISLAKEVSFILSGSKRNMEYAIESDSVSVKFFVFKNLSKVPQYLSRDNFQNFEYNSSSKDQKNPNQKSPNTFAVFPTYFDEIDNENELKLNTTQEGISPFHSQMEFHCLGPIKTIIQLSKKQESLQKKGDESNQFIPNNTQHQKGIKLLQESGLFLTGQDNSMKQLQKSQKQDNLDLNFIQQPQKLYKSGIIVDQNTQKEDIIPVRTQKSGSGFGTDFSNSTIGMNKNITQLKNTIGVLFVDSCRFYHIEFIKELEKCSLPTSSIEQAYSVKEAILIIKELFTNYKLQFSCIIVEDSLLVQLLSSTTKLFKKNNSIFSSIVIISSNSSSKTSSFYQILPKPITQQSIENSPILQILTQGKLKQKTL